MIVFARKSPAVLMTMIYAFMAMGIWQDDPGTNILDTGAPFYDVYECADGKFLAVGAIETQFYAELGVIGFAGEDRRSAVAVRLGDLLPGHRRPIGGRARQRAVLDPVEAVLGAAEVRFARGGAQNLQVAIDLRAIGVDDHTVDLLSKREGQGGLAACGRPGDDDEWRLGRRHGRSNADSSGTAR